jgi:hypothetical protein
MSSTLGLSQNQTATSSVNLESVLYDALVEYKKEIGKDLQAIWLASEMKTCQHVDGVLEIIRDHANAFERSDDQALMKWIDPLVPVLYTFSDAFGGVFSLVRTMNVDSKGMLTVLAKTVPPAKVILAGIGVLLGVRVHTSFSWTFLV